MRSVSNEEGFALPSVLMLMLILTLLAMSVLLMQHLRRMQAVMDVARVRADLAAQSGIARALSEPSSGRGIRTYQFADSSVAVVRTRPWGLLTLAESEGRASRAHASRTALLGASPPECYRYALTFANPSRQLILTGSATIAGDLALGSMGAAVGTLPGEQQPRQLPVTGSVHRGAASFLPPFESRAMGSAFASFDVFLGGQLPASVSGNSAVHTVDLNAIADSVEIAFMQGNIRITQRLIRREHPLEVYVQGDLDIVSGAAIEGLVAIYVTGSARVSCGARCENIVLMCSGSATIDSGVVMRGQVIAPSISVGPDAKLLYPSVLCSREVAGVRSARKINLLRRSRTEGMVILLRSRSGTASMDIVAVDREATVFGAIHAEGAVTLDGEVEGTALFEDLFFYQAPTSYHGWMRSGRIDRSSLPEGFAVPPALSPGKGEVMLWL
ncbi:hypothetical protein ANRL2_03426 [Anaerolineae bacterium]|nr:hypothetical protein ANRL2_03426 [Anaerolineae bacterium]